LSASEKVISGITARIIR